MAHRNRWFTYLYHGDFPWQTVSHNQMVVWKFRGTPSIAMDDHRFLPMKIGHGSTIDQCGPLQEVLKELKKLEQVTRGLSGGEFW